MRSTTTYDYPMTFCLRRACFSTPRGAFLVDASALREARTKTPKGEFHGK